MNICLISPPVIDPSMPWLAIFQLQSYLRKNFPDYQIDAFDLNIVFFNEIIQNPYRSLKKDLDTFNAYTEIKNIENDINESFNVWSENHSIKLSRQSLEFGFNQEYSSEVNDYINSDNKFSKQMDKLLTTNIEVEKYDLICFSINCYEQLIPSLLMSKVIKKKKKTIQIVIGGNVVSRIWNSINNISSLSKIVDYLIIQEGELPLLNLISYIKSVKIKYPTNNLIETKNNNIVDYTAKSHILDLSYIPMNQFTDLNMNLYFSPIQIFPISLGRGCSWGKCIFCGIHSSWCTNYRTRLIKHIVDEIEYLLKTHDIKYFRLVDESPAISDIILLSKEIIKRKLDINIEAYSNIDKRLILAETAEILSKAGFRQFFFGLESVDRKFLLSVKKGINNPDLYIPILNNLSEHGISNYGFFMIGVPNDNVANEKKLEEFITSCKSLNTIAVSSFLPVTNSTMVKDEQFNKKYNVEYLLRGDLTTRCDYKIGGKFVADLVNERAENMLKRIFEIRPDLHISSNLPYESRFYLVTKYGNKFSDNIYSDRRYDINTNVISSELLARSKGLSLNKD